MMRHLSLRAMIGAAIVLAVIVVAATGILYQRSAPPPMPVIGGIGGSFSLVDHHGKPVTDRDYLGKPTLVFFGFTSCPDVCPTTLLELSNLLKDLGSDGDRLNVLFITVDPDRDTPQKLALYLSSFDPRITGLSGTNEDIEQAIKAYKIYARKVPLEGDDYTMDHTAAVFLMNSDGQFVGTLNYQEPESTGLAKLRRLMGLGSF